MISGVIFDMDGVVSDTQRLHSAAEAEALVRYGIVLSSEEITRRFSGVNGREMLTTVFREARRPTPDLDTLIEAKQALLTERARGNIREMPGAVALIRELRARKLRLALASASRRSFIDLVLEELRITDAFEAITSGTEVPRGKPDPAIFLLAAERLGLAPAACFVLEDGVAGMIAAREAGMGCVAYIPHGDPADYPAQFYVRELSEVLNLFPVSE